jgi:hypothetical protein
MPNHMTFQVQSWGITVLSVQFTQYSKKYFLGKKEQALLELAKIVCGGDTPNRVLTPQSEGLVAIAKGFGLISKDDYDNMANQHYFYDALLAYCKSDKKGTSSRH